MVNLWKSINNKIIRCIKENKIDQLDDLLNQRQQILDSVDTKELKTQLGEDLYVDYEIQNLLQQELDKLKQQIKEYNSTKYVNFSYQRNLNKKINLFNKKV